MHPRVPLGPARRWVPLLAAPLAAAPLAAAVLAAAVLAAAGCAPAATGPPRSDPTGTVTVRTVDGDRTAVVHRPGTAGPGAPLVVVLHGAGGSGADVRANLGWDGLADRAGFVVAYPDGLDRTWNAGGCCGPARDRRVDDVGFLDALAAAVRRDAGTGPVHAVGFSNGAMLAYAWACARPGALAGIGPVAGARVVDCPAPAPLTVVAVHGTADERVPIAGGRGPSGADFPSLDASLAPFRAAAGCAAATAVPAPPARVDDRTCAGGQRVVSAVVDGLPHTWPGAGPAAGTSDAPLDATGFLWAHLQRAA
jgi:polyhydroxybutyrate depolymerase